MSEQRRFFLLAAAVAAAALGGGAVAGFLHHAPARPVAQAAWKDVWATAAEMARGAAVIVYAEAGETRPGRVAVSDDGLDRLPFEVTGFRVLRSVKGLADGARFTVERAGGWDGDTRVAIDADGGGFVHDGAYLLFLKPQPAGGHYYQVNDQARFRVGPDGRLAAVTGAGAAAELDGRTLEESLALLNAALR